MENVTLDNLYSDMKTAMREHDQMRLSVLRMLISSIKSLAIDKKIDANDLEVNEIQDVLAKQVKQRRDSIEAYTKGNRDDLVAAEQAELTILLKYMPQQMSLDEISEIVKQTKSEMKIDSSAQMGILIGAVMKKVKGRADGKLVQDAVRNILND